MTVEERLWELIKVLALKTSDGSVSWEKTVGRSSFQTSFPNFAVSIAEYTSDEEVTYGIKVFDEKGSLLEQATDSSISSHIEYPGLSTIFRTMQDLYTAARRKALGVDDALDELLSFLKTDEATSK